MSHLGSKQKQLLLDEAVLIQQIETCEACQSVLLDFIVQEGIRFRRSTLESIVLAIHRMELGLRTDICSLRLEKMFIANDNAMSGGRTK